MTNTMTMTAPLAPSAVVLAYSIETVTKPDAETIGGSSVSLTIRPIVAALATVRLEVGFTDASMPFLIDFDPSTMRIAGGSSGAFIAKVPGASDLCYGGRTPVSYKAVGSLRDDSGVEKAFSIKAAGSR